MKFLLREEVIEEADLQYVRISITPRWHAREDSPSTFGQFLGVKVLALPP